jgi:hypothetical protein
MYRDYLPFTTGYGLGLPIKHSVTRIVGPQPKGESNDNDMAALEPPVWSSDINTDAPEVDPKEVEPKEVEPEEVEPEEVEPGEVESEEVESEEVESEELESGSSSDECVGVMTPAPCAQTVKVVPKVVARKETSQTTIVPIPIISVDSQLDRLLCDENVVAAITASSSGHRTLSHKRKSTATTRHDQHNPKFQRAGKVCSKKRVITLPTKSRRNTVYANMDMNMDVDTNCDPIARVVHTGSTASSLAAARHTTNTYSTTSPTRPRTPKHKLQPRKPNTQQIQQQSTASTKLDLIEPARSSHIVHTPNTKISSTSGAVLTPASTPTQTMVRKERPVVRLAKVAHFHRQESQVKKQETQRWSKPSPAITTRESQVVRQTSRASVYGRIGVSLLLGLSAIALFSTVAILWVNIL